MAEERRHIHFYGRVQGVGFRYKAKYMAQSLGLSGWVKNEWDGTVTMEVQGSAARIDKLLQGLNNDRYISIDWMDVRALAVTDERGFYVKG